MTAPLDGRSAFRAAVLALVVEAVALDARELRMVDPDFADWPLEDGQMVDSLTTFARRPGRRVWMLARDFERIRARCPRFLAWRTLFDHAIVARRDADEGLPLPTALVLDGLRAVQVADRESWRGWVIDEPVRVLRLRDQLDARMQRAEPGFGATTLGL